MPELPEIVVLSQQMNETIVGKEIGKVEIFQPKCLNRSENDYYRVLPEQKVEQVLPHGKWIDIRLNAGDHLLINLGMGGEILYYSDTAAIPTNVKFLVQFNDKSGFYITLWWFGYFHLVLKGETNPMTDSLGEDPLQMSPEQFKTKLTGRRGGIKSFLLNQKNFRGIGNFYIQEILFRAKLHPLRQISSLSNEEMSRLYQAIQQVLRRSIELGSSSYELDFFGNKGKYSLKELSFAYEKDAVCPNCKTKTEKIKTGSTSQYICPNCQALERTEKIMN